MSTINNRPFYFSQIRVDPKNPDRVYRMAVDFAFSDDGGYSWRTGMLGIHEDYHGMWIDPNDPGHFIIGGDAGIFQTWDKGGTYDALNNMAMGQFYGVSYDFQVPYRVCGGLQDNGTSCGLSRRSNAPLQMTDWFAVNAADGLQSAQDPFNPDLVYYESQGGNINRRNLATGETVNIRARTVTRTQFGQQIDRIKGDGSKALTPEQLKEIADLRARMKAEIAQPNVATRWNWNTPFILSRHDANVFYSGAEKLFKSVRQGVDPFAISPDLSSRDEARIRITTGYDIEGNLAADGTGGITRDATGAEENATIVTIGESPLKAGVLYVGTNDGKVWLTKNDGGSWEDLSTRFPGVPPFTHVSQVEPSGSDSATVYVAFDNHRENDFAPYLYMSTDFGKTFTSIAKGLVTGRPELGVCGARGPGQPEAAVRRHRAWCVRVARQGCHVVHARQQPADRAGLRPAGASARSGADCRHTRARHPDPRCLAAAAAQRRHPGQAGAPVQAHRRAAVRRAAGWLRAAGAAHVARRSRGPGRRDHL